VSPYPLLVDLVRARIGAVIFAKVAGEDGDAARDRIHLSPGRRWFPQDAPICRVHADAAMFVGGIRALLLQSLHPLAMAGVAQHSGYRGDPWGRLQRTSEFLATTTFGTAADAERAVARVRGVHRRIRGVTSDGTPYAASDPHLLRWVHAAEADSFLTAYRRYGSGRLDQADRDCYVAQTAEVAEALGAVGSPRSERELHTQLEEFRAELRSTPEARAAARFILFNAPVSAALRPAYTGLAAAGVGLMPRWTRWPLRLPYLPIAEATVVRAAGQAVTSGIRWAVTAPADRPDPSVDRVQDQPGDEPVPA